MKYVRMQTNNDCMVCCLAMFSGKSYDQLIKYFPNLKKNNGVFLSETITVLDDLKVPYYYRGFLDWEEYLRQPIELNYIKDAIFSFPTNILLNSLGIEGKPISPRHAVIWNSEKKTFWCPANPPLSFIKSIFKSDARIKRYYKTLNASIKETFYLIERK
jgi:hypothetical protein